MAPHLRDLLPSVDPRSVDPRSVDPHSADPRLDLPAPLPPTTPLLLPQLLLTEYQLLLLRNMVPPLRDTLRADSVAREDSLPVDTLPVDLEALRSAAVAARVDILPAVAMDTLPVDLEAPRSEAAEAREDTHSVVARDTLPVDSVEARSAAAAVDSVPHPPAMEPPQCQRRCPRSTRPTVDTHKQLTTHIATH